MGCSAVRCRSFSDPSPARCRCAALALAESPRKWGVQNAMVSQFLGGVLVETLADAVWAWAMIKRRYYTQSARRLHQRDPSKKRVGVPNSNNTETSS